MARHIVLDPLGQESASPHSLGSPQKGPPVLGAKLGPLDKRRRGAPYFSGPLIAVGPPHLLCVVWEGSFLLSLGFCPSNPEIFLLVESFPTTGKEVLCFLSEVRREGKTGQLSLKTLFMHRHGLVVPFFCRLHLNYFKLK